MNLSKNRSKRILVIGLFIFLISAVFVFLLTRRGNSQISPTKPNAVAVVSEACGSIQGAFKAVSPMEQIFWGDLKVKINYLPEGSCYSPMYATKGGEEELRLYPTIEPNASVPHYGLSIFIRVRPLDTNKFFSQTCFVPVGYDDLRDEEFRIGQDLITITSRVDYIYPDAPYSNPNPYTPEIVEVILKMIRNIRIGPCD